MARPRNVQVTMLRCIWLSGAGQPPALLRTHTTGKLVWPMFPNIIIQAHHVLRGPRMFSLRTVFRCTRVLDVVFSRDVCKTRARNTFKKSKFMSFFSLCSCAFVCGNFSVLQCHVFSDVFWNLSKARISRVGGAPGNNCTRPAQKLIWQKSGGH